MGFKERLKELRKSKKMTQEALASAIGIPESTIRRYESVDDGLPRRERLERIADFFEVSVDYLIGRKPDIFFNQGDNLYLVELKTSSPNDKKDKKLSEFENLFFYELEKLSEEDKKKALEHVRYLRYLAEQQK
ncbi:XRE family transcriptional regulator [Brevibacillus brevis]|uniref:XRE family transcriptional regulator n=1 Tax=Brevibacillus brevis TaxID=1393 RepID=A0A2Z4MK84_BREBE|nr:helix-turn-helix transcriptional regulator [Brevibacillus brevis]AWX56925.1 XRE family transcriptional regulator [Brevibacillus brevis]